MNPFTNPFVIHFALVSMFSLLAASVTLAANTGEQAIQKLTQQNAGWNDMTASLDMEISSSSKTTKRAMRLKAKELKGQGNHSLLVFDRPNDVRGTALLSLGGGDDQQYLYMPATKRSRRISGGNRSGAFFGSEFSFEDIVGLTPGQHSFQKLGEGACGEATCQRIEARPKYDDSGYQKRVLHVENGTHRVNKIEFFDKGGKLLKTLTYEGYKKYNGKFWRADRWVMTNHKNKNTTTINFSDYKFDQGLSASMFTKAALKNVR